MTLNEFLTSSYTAFHTTENCEKILIENGFKKLSLSEKWNLKKVKGIL